MPLKMPDFKIGDLYIIKRQPLVKFLGVILGWNVLWKNDIKAVENKL